MSRRVLIAPDGFKGSMSSPKVCRAIGLGWKTIRPDDRLLTFPLADGGEGTVEALTHATAGELRVAFVQGPLGRKVKATWGLLGDGETAVIEMAAASGLCLLEPQDRNPLVTSSFGTGELMRCALDAGCPRIIVGLGGSATNDGGAGMLSALGAKFLDKQGNPLPPGGGFLDRLHRIDLTHLDPRIKATEFIAASDVDNPLCGREGASFVYGPQKGAKPEMVEHLDMALSTFARVLREQAGMDVASIPGAGAAGGMGAALALMGALPRSGVTLVMEETGLEKDLQDGVDLVITGEGRLDAQTIRGKVPWGVARVAKRYGVPVIALVGSLGGVTPGIYENIDAIFDIIPRPMSLEEALLKAEELLSQAAANLARCFSVLSKGY